MRTTHTSTSMSIMQACSLICTIVFWLLPQTSRAQSLGFELVRADSFQFGAEGDPFRTAYFDFEFRLEAIGADIYVDRRTTYSPPGLTLQPGNGLSWGLTSDTNLNGFGSSITVSKVFELVPLGAEPGNQFFEIPEGVQKTFQASFLVSTDKPIDIGFEILGINWTDNPLDTVADHTITPNVRAANVSLNAVPEPITALMFGLGSLALLQRRRR